MKNISNQTYKKFTTLLHKSFASEKNKPIKKWFRPFNWFFYSLELKYLKWKFVIKMKIFQAIRQNFLVLGINPYPTTLKNPFIANIVITLLGSVFSTTSYFLWLFHMATTFNEYVNAMFYIFGAIIITVGFSILVWKMKKWFRFIENLEIFINESKLNGKWKNIEMTEID